MGDETSVGYAINVFQDSINKYATEFLVNFNFLVRLLENYGFKLLGNEEAKHHGLPAGSGLFSELFQQMKREGIPADMSEKEKQISFLNRYFVFRKTHDVNAEKVAKSMNVHHEEKDKDKEEKKELDEGLLKAAKKALDSPPMFVKKIKRKIVLK